jgi:hypothetical protein
MCVLKTREVIISLNNATQPNHIINFLDKCIRFKIGREYQIIHS